MKWRKIWAGIARPSQLQSTGYWPPKQNLNFGLSNCFSVGRSDFMPKKTSGVNLKEFMSVQGFANPRFESLRTPIGRMTIHFEAVIRTAALCQHKGQRAKLPFGQIGKFDSQVKTLPLYGNQGRNRYGEAQPCTLANRLLYYTQIMSRDRVHDHLRTKFMASQKNQNSRAHSFNPFF